MIDADTGLLPSSCIGRGDDPECEYCLCQYGSQLGCLHPRQDYTCGRCGQPVPVGTLQQVGIHMLCDTCNIQMKDLT